MFATYRVNKIMSSENRKYIPHNSVLSVTSRVEEGLPIVTSYIMNLVIWGILARAKEQHNVKVCHFLFMSNHFHLLCVAEDPEAVSGFVGYVKQEIAHSINRMLGRRKKTIWCDGYDSPIQLTMQDTINKIKYLYANPSKADLVNTISEYPGVSSWNMFIKGSTHKKCTHIPRSGVPLLPFPALGVNEQKRIIETLTLDYKTELEFSLDPNAWMDCFQETRNVSPKRIKEINHTIVSNIQDKEYKFKQKRKAKNIEVMGATALRRQSMTKPYTPQKHSQKMICHSSDVNLRIAFLGYYKSLCEKAKQVYEAWKTGNLSLRMPPGMFAPQLPCLASALAIPL